MSKRAGDDHFATGNDDQMSNQTGGWALARQLCQVSKTRWWFQIFFIFTPIWGKIPNLTHIFHMGWNHQLEDFLWCLPFFSTISLQHICFIRIRWVGGKETPTRCHKSSNIQCIWLVFWHKSDVFFFKISGKICQIYFYLVDKMCSYDFCWPQTIGVLPKSIKQRRKRVFPALKSQGKNRWVTWCRGSGHVSEKPTCSLSNPSSSDSEGPPTTPMPAYSRPCSSVLNLTIIASYKSPNSLVNISWGGEALSGGYPWIPINGDP